MNKGFHKKAHINPEPGFQSGPGGSIDADKMAPCLLVTKPSPSLGRSSEKKKKGLQGVCSVSERAQYWCTLPSSSGTGARYDKPTKGNLHSRIKWVHSQPCKILGHFYRHRLEIGSSLVLLILPKYKETPLHNTVAGKV